MSPEAATAALDRQLAAHGEDVVLRRINPSPAVPTDVTVRARVMGYTPEEYAAGIQQGARRVILSAAAVAGFPLPIRARSTDRIVAHGSVMTIQTVDDSTRRVAGELIAYEIQAVG